MEAESAAGAVVVDIAAARAALRRESGRRFVASTRAAPAPCCAVGSCMLWLELASGCVASYGSMPAAADLMRLGWADVEAVWAVLFLRLVAFRGGDGGSERNCEAEA
eukprot:jgi/Ulvmu1/3883/UM018_0104.1